VVVKQTIKPNPIEQHLQDQVLTITIIVALNQGSSFGLLCLKTILENHLGSGIKCDSSS
jgi:hypothetical protein